MSKILLLIVSLLILVSCSQPTVESDDFTDSKNLADLDLPGIADIEDRIQSWTVTLPSTIMADRGYLSTVKYISIISNDQENQGFLAFNADNKGLITSAGTKLSNKRVYNDSSDGFYLAKLTTRSTDQIRYNIPATLEATLFIPGTSKATISSKGYINLKINYPARFIDIARGNNNNNYIMYTSVATNNIKNIDIFLAKFDENLADLTNITRIGSITQPATLVKQAHEFDIMTSIRDQDYPLFCLGNGGLTVNYDDSNMALIFNRGVQIFEKINNVSREFGQNFTRYELRSTSVGDNFKIIKDNNKDFSSKTDLFIIKSCQDFVNYNFFNSGYNSGVTNTIDRFPMISYSASKWIRFVDVNPKNINSFSPSYVYSDLTKNGFEIINIIPATANKAHPYPKNPDNFIKTDRNTYIVLAYSNNRELLESTNNESDDSLFLFLYRNGIFYPSYNITRNLNTEDEFSFKQMDAKDVKQIFPNLRENLGVVKAIKYPDLFEDNKTFRPLRENIILWIKRYLFVIDNLGRLTNKIDFDPEKQFIVPHHGSNMFYYYSLNAAGKIYPSAIGWISYGISNSKEITIYKMPLVQVAR